MVKKWSKYVWLIVSIFAIVFIVTVSIPAFIIPTGKSISRHQKELRAKKTDLQTVVDKLNRLKELDQEKEELEENSLVVMNAFPTKKEVGDIFIQIETIANETGSLVNSVKGAEAEIDPNNPALEMTVATTYVLEVTFQGYPNFKEYLSKTENALRFVTLDKFSVGKTDQGAFNVSLNYKAYYRN